MEEWSTSRLGHFSFRNWPRYPLKRRIVGPKGHYWRFVEQTDFAWKRSNLSCLSSLSVRHSADGAIPTPLLSSEKCAASKSCFFCQTVTTLASMDWGFWNLISRFRFTKQGSWFLVHSILWHSWYSWGHIIYMNTTYTPPMEKKKL